jgi:glycosyltransferase involved in cell wall biosynthesis
MKPSPFISICIPAYTHVDYLRRLLDSVLIQTYTDYEIVITDDSPDDTVAELVEKYSSKTEIRYFKNAQPLGTPENWNEAIRKANGKWIKIMHNDDWFASEDSLRIFYNNIQQHPDAVFFFSAFQNVEAGSGEIEIVKLSYADKKFFESNPYHLLKKVYVGNPSCTIVKKDLNIWYDKRYKYIVDFDYYIRVIQQTGMPVYIDEVLLDIGFHGDQVTAYTKFNPSIQLPENITFLNEQKRDILRNIVVFDYYWRLMRNMKINSVQKLKSYLGQLKVNDKITFVVNFQKNIPYQVLKIGVFSKFCMTVCYITTLFRFRQ